MNVLVFRVGQLGDMLASLPAFWAVREHFKNDRITLLSDVQFGKSYVLAKDLFDGAGLFDHFLNYVFHPSFFMNTYCRAQLLASLRAQHFDVLVYLYPPKRSKLAERRDQLFFRMAGISNLIGFNTSSGIRLPEVKRPMPESPHEAELVLARLECSEIPAPTQRPARMDLNLNPKDEREVDTWLERLPEDHGRPWIGIGPGSKMPAKIWPEECFRETVTQLVERHGFWPIVFGGPEDAALGERLISAWKCGYNAAGALGLRAAAAALQRCRLFVGNDTGTMHLAAAAKTPSVGIFSARDFPGRWNPYGVPFRALRRNIDCEGCYLTTCTERKMECMTAITARDAIEACEDLLEPGKHV